VGSQTNHKTFNGTRDDKLPETADRSGGNSRSREEALAEAPACVLSSKSEALGRSILELVGIRFSSPSLKEAKVNTN